MTKLTRPTPRLKLLWMMRTNSRHRHSSIASEIPPVYSAAAHIAEHEDLLVEILGRLPVKSLIRFRRVSREWLALIADPRLMKKQIRHQWERGLADSDARILFPVTPPKSLGLESVMDLKDEDFPAAIISCSLVATRKHDFPVNSRDFIIYGSCNGLICVQVDKRDLFLWNPFTRTSNLLPQPSVPCVPQFYGFGYDSISDDYKVMQGSHEPIIQVFSLKNGSWKTSRRGGRLPSSLRGQGTLLDGVLHWLEFNYLKHFITSEIWPFSLAEEKFQEPISIPHEEIDFVFKYGVRGLLVHKNCLCAHTADRCIKGLKIYMMKEYGVMESWTVLLKLSIDGVPGLYNGTSTPLFIFENGDFLAYNEVRRRPFLALYKKKDNAFKVVTRPFYMNKPFEPSMPFEPTIYKASIYGETLVSPVTGSECFEPLTQ